VAAAGSASLGLFLLGAPAGATSTNAFSLTTSGVALKVSVGGTTLTGGTSSASAGNATAAQAQGTGELTPAAVSSQQATAAAAGTSQTLPNSCAQPASPLPAPLGSLVALGAACSSATASRTGDNLPTATASGSVATVSVGPTASALPLPITPRSTVVSALTTVLGTLPPLPTTGTPLGTVLASVAGASGATLTSLVSAHLGTSSSSVTATSSTANAKSTASGSQINLLNGLGEAGGALLTITVGAAAVTVALNRSNGQVTATDTPAVVTVTLRSPVGGTQTYSLAPGASQTFLSGTPLVTTVAAGSGSATPGTGKGSASANGITVDAVGGLGATTATGTNGGLQIDMASTTAAVTAAVPASTVAAPVTTTTVPAAATVVAPVAGATTVHTGEFWSGPLPDALLGLAMICGLAIVARRRLLQAAGRLVLHRGETPASGDLPSSLGPGDSAYFPPPPDPARRLPR
jgi:hypothetical protein